jgi:RNA polymerase sigma factor (sigma-70 family)
VKSLRAADPRAGHSLALGRRLALGVPHRALLAKPVPDGSAGVTATGPRSRDDDRREELFRRYLPLAHGLALRFRDGSESVDHLCQAASIGLLQAIDRYDPEQEDAFSSLSLATILGELRRYLRDHTWSVHSSHDLQELSRRMVPTTEELAARLGRSPTIAEIAAALDISSENMLDARQALSTQESRVARTDRRSERSVVRGSPTAAHNSRSEEQIVG